MKTKILALFLLVSVTFFTGCATIMNGGPRHVYINSIPAGATVTITNHKTGEAIFVGTTPAIVPLPVRPATYNVKFSLAGYNSHNAFIKPTFSPWFLGNFVFGGPLGMLIDIGTGAGTDLTPRKMNVELIAEGNVGTAIDRETFQRKVSTVSSEPTGHRPGR